MQRFYAGPMKTLLRTLLLTALILWLGGLVFFTITAAVTFQTLLADTHTAGLIVGGLLRILHWMGMVCGLTALAALAFAPVLAIYKRDAASWSMALLAIMMALTAYSQFSIIPAMERDRLACGGAVDRADLAAPCRLHFEALHHRSVNLEGAVLLLGLATVVLVARAEGDQS